MGKDLRRTRNAEFPDASTNAMQDGKNLLATWRRNDTFDLEDRSDSHGRR